MSMQIDADRSLGQIVSRRIVWAREEVWFMFVAAIVRFLVPMAINRSIFS